MEFLENKRLVLPIWKKQKEPKPGKLFTDPLFPPNAYSLLGLDSKGRPLDIKAYQDNSTEIDYKEIEFLRASEIFKDNYSLFSEKIKFDDIIQGSLGDCYFLASIANLCKYPGLIRGLFKTDTVNKDGYYEIILRIDGRKHIVIVDDYFPVYRKNKFPCFSQPNENCIWVMLLEKAWAKVNGGYLNIIGGRASQALECLTGFGSLVYNTNEMNSGELNKTKDEIIKNIIIVDNNYGLLSCATGDKNVDETEAAGLITAHEYTLIKIFSISREEGENEFLFQIRNPWGKKEWNGDWSDNSRLWTEKLKNELNFKDKDEGIFFMDEKDFFNYFRTITICYIFYNTTSIVYTIEGKENLRNGCVFNIETEGDGFLSISAVRKSWRTNRELRGKGFPTHISIVKVDPNETDRFKIFSDYNGTYKSDETCTLNVIVNKGNYLVYVYRYFHDNKDNDKFMDIIISCSTKFNHAQMSYDECDKGFPLLQNIILTGELAKRNIDPSLKEDCNFTSNQLCGNGIIAFIFYNSIPGCFNKLKIDHTNLILLSPNLGATSAPVNRVFPSGKYFVFLSLINKEGCASTMKIEPKMTYDKQDVDYDDNEIDLTLYTNIENNIKNEKFRKKRNKGIRSAQKETYYEGGNDQIIYKSLEELRSQHFNLVKLLDDLPVNNNNDKLKWGMKTGNYVQYIGQFKDGKKEGIGLFINPHNIFVGEFKDDLQNGIGYVYNRELKLLFYANYENGMLKGKPVRVGEINQDEGQMKKLEMHLMNKKVYNYGNGERYQGDMNENEKKHGIGSYNYNNGDKYIGCWKDNKKEGIGKYTYLNKDKYIGDFKNDLREGRGKLYLNDGRIVESEFKEDKMQGPVKIYFKDGQKYEGEFKDQKIDGKGTFYYNNGAVYNGEWKDNEKHGRGVFCYKNGDKYEGTYKNDKMDGKGVFHYSNGEQYEGDFKNNIKEGKGVYKSSKGKTIYEGDWKEGRIEGKGTFYYNNGDKYDGYWKDGKMEGPGTFISRKGEKYEGEWKHGAKDGKGAIFSKDGDKVYEGDYKNDLRDGKGVAYYKNGDKYEGEWKKDKKEGRGSYILANGNKLYEGDWKNDEMEGKGILYHNNGAYQGDVKNGQANGKGIYYFNNGDKYGGDFWNNKFEGKGIFEYYNTGTYEGFWRNGLKHGKGAFYLPDGTKIYEGDWRNDLKEGNGIFKYNSGIYSGEWKEDKKEGKGIYSSYNGDKYEGDWKNDLRDGKGINIWSSGEKYEGDWKEGNIHGKGVFYYFYGIYQGSFNNNIKEGKGIFYLNDGQKIYEGDWKNDVKEGKGTFYYSSGTYDGDWKNDVKDGKGTFYFHGGKYEGDWRNGAREGKGILYIGKNKVYEGDWRNDCKEGRGIFYYDSGVYEGDWVSDVKHGNGTFLWKSGEKYEGEWKNDVKDGRGIFYSQDGSKIPCLYSNDEFIKRLD